MNMKTWFRIVFCVVGVSALMGVIWYALPLLAFAGYRPFDNPAVQITMMVIAAAGAFGYVAWDVYKRLKGAKEIEGGIAGEKTEEGDGAILATRMKDALETLKKSSGSKADYLYDLPWYVIIGPPGSGKTTALINSGLRFPLSRGVTPQAIAGVGGTRYCDWWFTEEAVFVDTAGRYTTQDSDAGADKKSWLSFLDVLKKGRPKQPINGVIVAISISDILGAPAAEVEAHADAIRARLIELHDRLKVDFPVYALFTKADLIAGFVEYFGHLNEKERAVVWGHTFQTNDKTKNMVGHIPEEFDALVQRLNLELADRLQDEPTPTARVMLFGFPTQVAALKKPIVDFLDRIFEPTRYHSNATLRGFYLTSGTQEGTPFDQLIGALSRSFGTQEAGRAALSGLGKSFFLTDLLIKVIIGEASWVSTNRAAVRRQFILKTAAYSLLTILSLGAFGVWWTSYSSNSDLIGQTRGAVLEYRQAAGPMLAETHVTDSDFARILPVLHQVENVPTGYASRETSASLWETFGLSQRQRLSSATESAYQAAIERLFRPRIYHRLEDVLHANLQNPSIVYDVLRVYLMIAGREQMEQDTVLGWFRRYWAEVQYPGAGNAGGRAALERHLAAMLAFDPPPPERALSVDESLIAEARATLARMSIADSAFERLRTQARTNTAGDWVMRRRAGQDATLVFEGTAGEELDAIRVPYFFTYDGFHDAFLARLPEIAQQIQRERRLLGDLGQQAAIEQQVQNLAPALYDRYSREFVATWRGVLARVRIRVLTADHPRYVALQAIGAATSPLTQIITSIRDETRLTRERPANQRPANAPAPPASLPALSATPGDAPGASIEAQFRGIHALVEGDGGRRPTDALQQAFAEIHQSLVAIATPGQAASGATANLPVQLQTLRATAARFPQPFQQMILNAANAFENQATGGVRARLAQLMAEQVTRLCRDLVPGRYPFTRESTRDISVQDFQRLFGAGGSFATFFQQNLQQYANTTQREWVWNQQSAVGRSLSTAALRSFQRAAEIREAFFPGGSPMFTVAINNLSFTGPAESARLEINGVTLDTTRPPPELPPQSQGFSLFPMAPAPPRPTTPTLPPPPTVFQWPGPGGLGRAAISFTPDSTGRPALLREGPWALFRLLDAAAVTRQNEALRASFSSGGRAVVYRIVVSTVANPLTLPALRDFQCPGDL